MTQAQAAVDADPPGQPAGPPRRTGYLDLLRLPGAARFSVAAAVGRTPMAMFGLGSVLLLRATTGQYGLAGTIAGAGSIGYAVSAPRLARLADHFGQRRVLQPIVAIFAVASLVFGAELHAPVWALFVTGMLAGSSMPSLGSMVRARWSHLLAGSPALHSAFALESVADEMIFVAGPAVVTLLATKVLPAAGVLVSMVVCLIGTLLFAAQRRTEPPPEPAGTIRPAGTRRSLPGAGLLTLFPCYLFLGMMFASIDLCTVDFAQIQGYKPVAGLILGTYALGSAVGGLWYGARIWRVPLERRFLWTLALTVAGVATFWAQPNLVTLDLSMLAAGLTIAPTLIAGYGLTERQAPEPRRTEAMTWLSSGIYVGVAIGSGVSGHIADAFGPRPGYLFAAGCGLLAVTTCLLGRRRLRATSEAGAAQ